MFSIWQFPPKLLARPEIGLDEACQSWALENVAECFKFQSSHVEQRAMAAACGEIIRYHSIIEYKAVNAGVLQGCRDLCLAYQS